MTESVNPVWADVKPMLSILIPFLNDDPTDLLAALVATDAEIAHQVEIVVLDDGTGSDDLTQCLTSFVRDLPVATRLITRRINAGRSRGRNQLAQAARGRYFLFLDADMRPDGNNFIAAWLNLIDKMAPEVAFGGFSLLQAPSDKRFAVHRAMASRSDCLNSTERQQRPEKHIFTSNLLIRRDVFEAHQFDPDFTGWGWEDVEWGMRVSKQHPILHPHIPATHMGLDEVETLKKKYRQSADNFARIAQLHPEFVTQYPSYKAAMVIKQRGLSEPVKAISGWISDQDFLPVRLRAFSMRVYRSALYAKAL